jgi:hypothetical protein
MRTTSSRSWETTDTVAVIPGIRIRPGLSALIIALYVTTFWATVGCSRTCSTRPRNVRSGNESTRNVTSCPVLMRPTSASSTDASTCMRARSFAITKSVGACSDAATVWPTSTLREMTTPEMGP